MSSGAMSQIAAITADVFPKLAPIGVGDGLGPWLATAHGERVTNPDHGQLLVGPGVFFITLSGRVSFLSAARVTVAVVLAGDVRFRGPRVTVEHNLGAMHLDDKIDALDADFIRGRRRPAEWDRTVTRSFSAFKLISVPDGGPVRVGIWSSAEPLPRSSASSQRVEFADLELSVLEVGDASAITTVTAEGGAR